MAPSLTDSIFMSLSGTGLFVSQETHSREGKFVAKAACSRRQLLL